MRDVASFEAQLTGEVLVVDDSAQLLDITQAMLTKLGCRVVCRAHPRQALDYIAEQPGQVAIMITDQSMPEMSGMDLIREVAALPSAPACVLMTGAHVPTRMDEYTAQGISAVLPKPFLLADLQALLNQLVSTT